MIEEQFVKVSFIEEGEYRGYRVRLYAPTDSGRKHFVLQKYKIKADELVNVINVLLK